MATREELLELLKRWHHLVERDCESLKLVNEDAMDVYLDTCEALQLQTFSSEGELTVGDRVTIADPAARHNKSRTHGTIIGPARNTAHFEVKDDSGRVWDCHWAYLRKDQG